jgi:hypothetical protein
MNRRPPLPANWPKFPFWPLLITAAVAVLCFTLAGCGGPVFTSGGCSDDAGKDADRCFATTSSTTTAVTYSTGGQQSRGTETTLGTGGAQSTSTFGGATSTDSTGGTAPSSTAGAGSSPDTGGSSSTGGSSAATSSAPTCDPTNYVNWSCGNATGPAAGAPSGTPDDSTPAAQWTCVRTITAIVPPNPTFGEHQTTCSHSYSYVCFHC